MARKTLYSFLLLSLLEVFVSVSWATPFEISQAQPAVINGGEKSDTPMQKHTKRVLGDLNSQEVVKERVSDAKLAEKEVQTIFPDVKNIWDIMRTVGGVISAVEDSLSLLLEALEGCNDEWDIETFEVAYSDVGSTSSGLNNIRRRRGEPYNVGDARRLAKNLQYVLHGICDDLMQSCPSTRPGIPVESSGRPAPKDKDKEKIPRQTFVIKPKPRELHVYDDDPYFLTEATTGVPCGNDIYVHPNLFNEEKAPVVVWPTYITYGGQDSLMVDMKIVKPKSWYVGASYDLLYAILSTPTVSNRLNNLTPRIKKHPKPVARFIAACFADWYEIQMESSSEGSASAGSEAGSSTSRGSYTSPRSRKSKSPESTVSEAPTIRAGRSPTRSDTPIGERMPSPPTSGPTRPRQGRSKSPTGGSSSARGGSSALRRGSSPPRGESRSP